MFKSVGVFSSVLLAISLSACGGGGSSSDNSSDGSGNGSGGGQTIDSSSLGTAATTLSKQIISREGNTTVIPAFGKTSSSDIPTARKTALEAISASFTSSDTTVTEGECGGSLITDLTITADDVTFYPYSGELEATYMDFCEYIDEQGSSTINGNIYSEFNFPNEDEGTMFWRINISAVSNHPNLTFSGSYSEEISCTYTNGVNFDIDSDSCTNSLTHVENDTTYKTESVIVTGNNSSGYDLDFEFSDDENTYDVSLTSVTVCENGNLGSGMGTISINEETINLDFISCDQVTITYNNESETVNQ